MIPEWVMVFLRKWVVNKKSGSITISFSEGGVRNLKETHVCEPPKKKAPPPKK